MNTTENKSQSQQQAVAQLESIVAMVAALNLNQDNDEAREAIQEDPLSVEVRSGWCSGKADMEPEEFCIVLCTGGPAVRIIGDIQSGEPTRPRIQHQDWGTGWTEYFPTSEEREALETYCQQFYFGE